MISLKLCAHFSNMASAPGLALILLPAIATTCSAGDVSISARHATAPASGVCSSKVTTSAYTIQSQVTQTGGKTTFAYTVTRKTTQFPTRLTSFAISIPDCLANGRLPDNPPVQIVKIGSSYLFQWNFGFPANGLKATFTVTFAGSLQSNSRNFSITAENFVAWSTIGGHVDPATICGPSACQPTTQSMRTHTRTRTRTLTSCHGE
eukprot:jgi/Chlat1/7181/Chrsp57S06837